MKQHHHDYRPEIDGLRAFAVLAVIIHHFSAALAPSGFLGVDIFFVISGYVITNSLLASPDRQISSFALGFYARRIKRLFPALTFCVLITSLLGALFISPEHAEIERSFTAGAMALAGLSNFYFFYKSYDYFAQDALFNLFTHTWSLGVEDQFYLLYPFLVWAAIHWRRSTTTLGTLVVVLAALSLGAFFWLTPIDDATYFLMPTRFWEISAGCLAALGTRSSSRAATLKPARNYLAAAALVLSVIALLAPVEMRTASTPAIVACTAVLIVCVRPGGLLFRLLTWGPIVLVGQMSYSLYLWHWSVLSLARWTAGIDATTAPLLIAAIIAISAFSYFVLEQPLRYRQWATSSPKTVLVGAVAIALSLGGVGAIMNLPLYRGATVNMAAKGIETLLDDRLLNDGTAWPAQECFLSSDGDKIPSPHLCNIGSLESGGRRFVVIGNSQSAAEFELFTALSEQGRGQVTVTSAWGASPVHSMPNDSPWSNANDYYWTSVIPDLVSSLTVGDVVIMANEIQDLTPEVITDESLGRLNLLKEGLEKFVQEAGARGIEVIFQAPMTFVRDAKCSPDVALPQWYYFGGPGPCRLYSKEHSLSRRKPLMDILHEIELAQPNFRVLDLFPVLCPGDICGYFNHEMVPLYRDRAAHLSVEANYLGRPILIEVVNRALSRKLDRSTLDSSRGLAPG